MKKFLKYLYLVFFLVIVSLALVTSVYVYKGYSMYKNALDNKSIDSVISSIESKEDYVNLDDIPDIYINAVISVEDHRFYKHGGIDIIAIGRAFLHDLKAMDLVEGGSTITQQLAKNIYFTQDKKIVRKIAEVFMAWKLEKELSKDKILELYLNTSYFGDGYYTIKEASVGYFGKEPLNLTDSEAVMLAGIPNAPSIYAPTNSYELAKERQKQVLNKMVEYGYISKEEMDKLYKEPVNIVY